jgi:phage minor structural protein
VKRRAIALSFFIYGGENVLTITDIYGNTEGLTGYKNLRRYRNVSGEKSLAFFVLPTQQNAHSFEMVAEESIVDFDGEPYRIKQIAEKPRGATYVKEVVAVHTLFDLIDDHQYATHTGSLTLDSALNFVLNGTGYTWVVADTFATQTWENFGDDNRLALLQDVLKRYGAEFTLAGTQLTFRRKIGNATDFQFRYNYNVKTLARDVNTNNLSTYIKGYGKEIESEYTSPNADIFGIKHAKPVRDERYTTLAGLNERLVAELKDTPEVSITIDFADMRRAGFPYDVPNEGDDVFLIYEPMGIDVEARLMEITELFTESSELPVKTEVTIGNIRRSLNDKFIDFSRTQKQVDGIIDPNGRVKYSVLDGAVQRATEALQSAQTELEFENGIIARSKDNPNHIVLLNSAGIGVSVDGGATFRTAVMGDGIVADLITVGTMLFDRLKGGEMTLGGINNEDGIMTVLDANGEKVAELNASRGGFDKLFVGDFYSPTVPNVTQIARTYYVDGVNGSDLNDGLAWETAKKSISAVIAVLPKVIDHAITIRLHDLNCRNLRERLRINGFVGAGNITIDGQDWNNQITGFISVVNCSIPVIINDLTIDSQDNIGVQAYNSFVTCNHMWVWGKNNEGTCYFAGNGGKLYLTNCEGYDSSIVIYAKNMGEIYIENCKGLGYTRGAWAQYGSTFRINGTYPAGTVGNLSSDTGSDIIGSGYTANSGARGTTPPPVTKTTTQWKTTSGSNYGDLYNAWESGVKQGNYGYGQRKGLWYFGTQLSALQGKTIKNMRVWVKRSSRGGSSGKVSLFVRTHNYTAQPAGSPTLSSGSARIDLAWGESGWVTLPQTLIDQFNAGTAKGVGVWANSTSTAYYSIMESECTVEATYE